MVRIKLNETFTRVQLVNHKCKIRVACPCKHCVRLVKQILERQNMSSFSEEELNKVVRRHIIGQPRNFEERRLFDIEFPREFQRILNRLADFERAAEI